MQKPSLLVLAIPLFVFVSAAAAAPTSLSCISGSVSALVRAEGVAEAMGDIVLNCTGTPGGTVDGNLTVFLSVNITNRLSSNNTVNATLTADTAPAPVQGIFQLPNSVVFSGLNLTVSPTGTLNLRISNLRGAADQVASGRAIQAFLALSGGSSTILGGNTPYTVATPATGLLANFSSSIFCSSSPLPATISLSNLFAEGTRFASTRLTEGFPSAFQRRGPTDDSGTRFIVTYSGFPANSRVFVPDAVAGSDALVPTAGGDLGVRASGGQYAPSSNGSLLLLRVIGTDPNGKGGFTVTPAGFNPSGVSTFDSVGEIQLQNGSGIAVYEVVDANPTARESAQFPTFLSLPAATTSQTATVTERVSFAPVSTADMAAANVPIPRFAPIPPPSDCSVVGDCNASYFPKLNVISPSLQFTAQAGSQNQVQYVQVQNINGGPMTWNATVSYTSGSGWLTLSPSSGLTSATIRIDLLPQNLTPGTYQAVLAIDAGQAGSRTLPVSVQVNAAPPPAPTPTPAPVPTPAITGVVNTATFTSGPVVSGSLATIKGSKLSGNSVSVSFDGLLAKLLFVSDEQINLQVPPDLGAKTTAQMIVTVDGIASAPQAVSLVSVAPGIFTPGILNQNNSVNGPDNAAPAGSIVQIFATGLGTGTSVTARIGNTSSVSPYYAGPAPDLIGVQQVNILIPADAGTGAADIQLCGAAASTQPVCSPSVKLYLR